MSNQVMTMVQLAALRGTDATKAIFDQISTQFPELTLIPGRGIQGISYPQALRKALPKGGFRDANSDGVTLTSSDYDLFTVQCYILDIQLEIDKAVAMAHPFGEANFISDEQTAAFRGTMAVFAEQLYHGDAKNSSGFNGFDKITQDSAGAAIPRLVVDCGGVTGSGVVLSSAYVARVGIENGVSWAYGNNGNFLIAEDWIPRQKTTNGKAKTVMTYGSTSWVGLNAYPTSVVRIANIPVQEGATNLFSDFKIAQAINRFPHAYPPTHIFMNRQDRYMLQLSRSIGISGIQQFVGQPVLAPTPTESNGLPIVITDGIIPDGQTTEAQQA